jgi:F-type H+-transporting ATPase subunit b
MFLEAEVWVAFAFIIFLGLLGYIGAHRTIAKALDDRTSRIKAELGEAQGIISGAQAEAERLTAEAKTRMEEFVSRRTKMAETKIAQAEAQATADVRAAAAEAAVSAAEKILRQQAQGPLAEQLIARGIDDVRKKLN